MGLDQFAFARKGKEKDKQIFYWRKHANLEGWMAKLYAKKGGKATFNNMEVELTLVDLLKLREDHRRLKKAEGFFWGTSQPEDDGTTADFIRKALSYLNLGYTIIYKSCW